MRLSQAAKFAFALAVLSQFVVFETAHARKSKRVMDHLAVQDSREIGTTAQPEPTTTVVRDGADGQLPTGTAKSIGWMASTGHASTATTGVVAATGTTGGSDNQAAQIAQALLGALTGKGGAGSTGATGSTATPTSTGGGDSTNMSQASEKSSGGKADGADSAGTDKSGSQRQDEVDPDKPLPTDTNVDGRDCSATRKTWQPFTKHPFKINSCFGHRASTGSHHNGLDVTVLKQPQSINPVAPGKIARAGLRGGYGCEIIIEHDSCPAGVGGTKCFSQYAHLKKDKNGRCPGVKRENEKVNPCTELAMMGNTGASHAPHLHFEVRTSLDSDMGKDPNKVFKEWQAHKNYQKDKSTCGTVGSGKAPNKQTPTKSEGAKSGGVN